MKPRYRIQFPQEDSERLNQDEAYFILSLDTEVRRIRFHDYAELYRFPGLYEQLYYERLKCRSPFKVAEILASAMQQTQQNFSELRVLDLGSGNGIMGEALQKHGVSRLVGVDIIPEAGAALERDRPNLYDGYLTANLCELTTEQREYLETWSFNCLTTVAALGFGDIPVSAFVEAFNLLQDGGWVAFNIKERFFGPSDNTGFSQVMRELIFHESLHLHHVERYRHRLSIEGRPLYYYAVAGRKTQSLSPETVARWREVCEAATV